MRMYPINSCFDVASEVAEVEPVVAGVDVDCLKDEGEGEVDGGMLSFTELLLAPASFKLGPL